MPMIAPLADLAGRILIAILFLYDGYVKIFSYNELARFMLDFGVPTFLAPVVIVAEIGLALLLVAGWQTRIVAFLIGGYCVLTALIFHTAWDQGLELVMFLKNLAIAGGLGAFVANGAGPWSLDRLQGRR
ncbi:MAG: DoxX family protein [Pseudomonadota bacterium]|nr:DoxX family protein [Pseudomonadota bacterium]